MLAWGNINLFDFKHRYITLHQSKRILAPTRLSKLCGFEREDRSSDLTMLTRMTGCNGMYLCATGLQQVIQVIYVVQVVQMFEAVHVVQMVQVVQVVQVVHVVQMVQMFQVVRGFKLAQVVQVDQMVQVI